MHPRMLASDGGCSGGTCPAVYDDDPDLPPDELAIVGKKAGAGLRARLATASHLTRRVVVIKREIVSRRPAPGSRARRPRRAQAQFETFSYSAFRLETLQYYAGTGRDDQWDALLKAEPPLGARPTSASTSSPSR